MPELTLRSRLSVADGPGIATILRSVGAFRDSEAAVGLELFEESLDPGPSTDYRWTLAELGGELVGFACYGEVPMTTGTFDLYWIAVRPDCWGKDVATRLVAAVESSIRSTAGRWLLIETTSAERHARACGFYRRRGFALLSTIPDYYREGEDRLLFGKRLDDSRAEGRGSRSTMPGVT